MATLEGKDDFFDLIKDKYPRLVNETRVHIWPDKNIIIRKNTVNDKVKKSIEFLDTEELIALAECDGRHTSQEILSKLVSMNQNDSEKINNFIKFFKKYNGKYFVFEDSKQNLISVFEITGSKRFLTPMYFTLEINDTSINKQGIINTISEMYNYGCRTIEIVGCGIIFNKDLKEIIKLVFEYYEFVLIRVDDFDVSRSVMKIIQDNKDKVVFAVDTQSENDFTKFKKEINRIDLIKKGYTIIDYKKEMKVGIGELLEKVVINVNRNVDIRWSEIFIRQDKTVELINLLGNDFVIGSLDEESIEDILYKRDKLINMFIKIQNSSRKTCIHCKNIIKCKTCIDAIVFNVKNNAYCDWVLENKLKDDVDIIDVLMI